MYFYFLNEYILISRSLEFYQQVFKFVLIFGCYNALVYISPLTHWNLVTYIMVNFDTGYGLLPDDTLKWYRTIFFKIKLCFFKYLSPQMCRKVRSFQMPLTCVVCKTTAIKLLITHFRPWVEKRVQIQIVCYMLSEAHLKLKSGKISFIHNSHCINPIVLTFCTLQCYCGALYKISKRSHTWAMGKRDLTRSEFKMISFCGVGDMQQPPGHNDVWVCTSRRGWLIDITEICWHSLNRISAVVTIQR